MNFKKLKRSLPVANASFRYLRSQKLTYVDKTEYVYDLAMDNQPKVLVRPRRFGKSTLMSALEELFQHGVKPYDGHDSYFKGLAIEKLWDDPHTYPVLHLDFYDLDLQTPSCSEFEKNLNDFVLQFAQEQGVKSESCGETFVSVFRSLLKSLPDGSLVLLVDEFDAPLIYRLHDPAEIKQMKELLRALFGSIKIYANKFRCVFMTGITRYQDLGFGTAGGSFTDISHDIEFGASCGYTREELKRYFADNLRYAAARRCNCLDEDVTAEQIESLLDEMSVWYDGFCFDRKQKTKVFSTWSVLRFFSDEAADLMPYWSNEEALGMPQLLKTFIDKIDLKELLKNEMASGGFSITSEQFFSSSVVNPKANPYALLFQTGYLTLVKPFLNGNAVHLDCPNKEISLAFADLVAKRMFREQLTYNLDYNQHTVQALSSLDPDRIKEYFNHLFAVLPYENYPVSSEGMAAALINFNLRGAGLKPRCEVSESLGRADLEVDLKEQELTLVFEFKYTVSAEPKVLDAKLSEALAQIKARDYGHTADSQPRIARFGLVFCGAKDQRRILRLALADIVSKD